MTTTRHYPYTCAACGHGIESTTSRFVRWSPRLVLRQRSSGGSYWATTEPRQIRVCRSAKKCGNPQRRAELLGVRA